MGLAHIKHDEGMPTLAKDRQSAEDGDNLAQKFGCHVTLRLGVIHAMEE